MTDFNPRDYKGYRLEKTGEGLSLYYVKVFDLSKVKDPKCDNLSNNPDAKAQHTTKIDYRDVIDAFADAYGWIDCISRDKSDPDSYEKAYNKLKKDERELYRYPYLNKQESDQKESNGKWEYAYKNGWEKNLKDEKKVNINN
jgi:hypothetical protein